MTDGSEDEAGVTPYEVSSKFGSQDDYDRLIDKFGADRLDDEVLERLAAHDDGDLHRFFRRDIICSHRNFGDVLDRYEEGDEFYLYTGRAPSGDLHLGHVLPFELTRYLQDVFDVNLVIQVPDEEKYLFKEGLTPEDTRRYGLRNIEDILALGFDPDKTDIFFNMDYGGELYPTAVRVSKHITFSQVKATMGFEDSTNIGSIFYTALQATPAFLGSVQSDEDRHCLVPLAIDQDPHFRLARDVAPKLGYPKPSILHMKFLPSLQGRGKMSSSKEHTFVGLRDSVEEAKEKIDRAKTGGRVTAAEQREKGADPDDDMVFQLMAYLLVDDDEELNDIYERYASGDLLSGELKQLCKEYLEDFLTDHHRRREEVKGNLDEYLISGSEQIDW